MAIGIYHHKLTKVTIMKTGIKACYPVLTSLCLGIPVGWSATLPAPVPRVIVSAASSWGSATDSWAGYTGQLNVWVPTAITGGWTLKFQSADLGKEASANSFWNATASYDPVTQTFTLSSPSWGGDVQANTMLSIGFNGSGFLNTAFALSNCNLNGQPCVASVMTSQDSQQTLANLQQSGSTAALSTSTATGGTTGQATASSGSSATTASGTPMLQVLFSVNSAWQGGYGGNISVKNLSGNALVAGATGWQAKLKFPDLATAKDVFKSGPWNFQVAFSNDGGVTLTPTAWSSALAPGDTASSGFNGGFTANLLKAASADPSVAVLYSTSSSSTSNTTTSSTSGISDTSTTITPTATTTVNNDFGLPTGSVTGGFLYSPYKDVGISMNWNTNQMSTAVTGSLAPLLNVLPLRVPAITWAFATGECGQENWGGINPDALAGANVQKFVNANKNYVISTGGAAGAFTCSSATGMRAFINRYASKNLVGVDFDIEAGQSAAAINTLVQQIKAVESDYPNLRFSFTIATLGSTNGTAASSPYGDLSVTGYNVMQALSKYPLANYTINLMVMDYGAATSGNCVVGATGRCDMGQTAIQAVNNLASRYGVPPQRIELTPMIGVNDVSDELFSLQDADTLAQWSKANGLAGIHFWSIDRDTPCSQTSASPICSSVNNVPAWGWTQRFISDLGL